MYSNSSAYGLTPQQQAMMSQYATNQVQPVMPGQSYPIGQPVPTNNSNYTAPTPVAQPYVLTVAAKKTRFFLLFGLLGSILHHESSPFVKTVQLPDGTIIQKNLAGMLIKTASGKVSAMSPAPLYSPPKNGFVAEFISKKGFVEKLAWDKFLGGDHWCKRYIVLDREKLYWYKSPGDAQPRGIIPLVPGSWVKAADKDTPKRKDAHPATAVGLGNMMTSSIGQLASEHHGVVGKNNCIGVHRPFNMNKTLNTVMGNSAMSLAFGGGVKELQKSQPRTFYFYCTGGPAERDEWERALSSNLKNYLFSEECFNETVRQFCEFLRNFLGVSGAELWDWKPILNELYSEN